MTQPLNIAMVISADGSAAAKGIEEAKREVQGLGAAAKTSATGVTALASANDQAAAAARRAAQAVVGQGQAEVQARTQVALSTGQLRMQTQNLSFQFQDIATMMATGQNPFTLLAQQLPQVTMHGGQLTGVMGALKQSVSGLFSPLGLLTTGFVLAGSAAISYFTDVEDEAANAELSLDEQRTLIRQVADEWGDLVPALRAYSDELERAERLGQLTKATQAAIAAQFDEAALSTGAAKTAIGETVGELLRLNNAAAQSEVRGLRDDFNEFDQAAQDLAKTLKEGGDTTAGFERFQRTLSDLLGNDAVQASDALRAAIEALRDAYSEAAGAAGQLAREQSGVDERGGIGLSGYEGGRGADPRTLVNDDYWENRFFPKPEKARKEPRTPRARKSQDERDAETYARIVRQAEMAIEMEMLEAQALGMTAEAADRLRITQELLNQARAAGIQLGPEQVAELTALGATMAQVTAETQAQAEAFELRRDVITDVIGGIRRAAEDGKITMQELLDISMRVLDRIIDKIQNELIDALMGVSGAGGGGGGLFGGLLKGLFGGSTFSPAASGVIASGGMTGLFSTGGYTGRGNPARAAGLVHQEEYVFSAPAVRAIGVGNLERMHRTAKSGRGFAEGGYTGGGFPAGMSGGMGMGGTQRIVLEINEGPMFRTTMKEEAVNVVGQAAPVIVSRSKSETFKSLAKGDADKIMAGRYGSRPQASRKT